MRSVGKYFKRTYKKIFLLIQAISFLSKYERNKIFKVHGFLKDNDVRKSANDYLFQSLNSIISIKKYQKLGFGDGLDKVITSRKSDMVFILGSGPSINTISEKNWRNIRKHDSWGFNWWFLHDFVPTHYFFQSSNKANSDNLMSTLLKEKLNDYKKNDSIILARGDNVNYFRFHDSKLFNTLHGQLLNIYFLAEHFIHGCSNVGTDILIKKMYALNCFSQNKSQNIPKFRSTVGFLIPLALIAGYKKIVLCGIDMNDNIHFFDDEKYIKKYPGLSIIININKNFGLLHPHVGKGIHSVKNYILALKRFANIEYKAELFVNNKESSLYPDIKKHYFTND